MTEAVLHYNRVAKTLHWVIGALVITNILIGLFHDPLGELFKGTMGLHKSIGFTVLALSLVRLYWRLTHRPPQLPAGMAGWERLAAQATHWTFYGLMIILPMTGWIFSSAGKYPLSYFGLFEIPKLAVEKGMPIVGVAHEAHEILGIAWAVLAVIHIGAALRHQFLLKDDVLSRMWEGAPGRV